MNVRPFTEDDFPMVAGLLSDDERFHGRTIQIGVNEVHEWTSTTELATDSWLYEDADGPAAVGWCATEGEVGFAIGVVHPRAKGHGLGAELVDRSEAALRTRDIARLHQFVIGADTAAATLMTERGYRDVRRFYDMAIQLDAAPEVADLSIEVFREDDARAFHEALDEAFQDHWEHHGRGFEDWWDRHRANPNFDPTLWFLIRDGDEIAAVCRNEGNRNGGGYVRSRGVRAPWPGQG